MGDGKDHRVVAKPSVPDLFARLIADAREWVAAEIALIKCRGEVLVGRVRTAVVLLLAALILASVALIALAVGLILMLATLVGPGWATLIVVVALLVLAGLFAWRGVARLQTAFKDPT